MAVQLEFLNLIIPVQVIEQKYSGGWDACLEDHAKSIGRVVWYDDHLFRTGAMDGDMIANLIEKWTNLGFEATDVVDEKTVWRDLCVVDAFGFSQHDSPWIVVDGAERTAWRRGCDKGDVIGREQFRP
jgi:hypothetical protein